MRWKEGIDDYKNTEFQFENILQIDNDKKTYFCQFENSKDFEYFKKSQNKKIYFKRIIPWKNGISFYDIDCNFFIANNKKILTFLRDTDFFLQTGDNNNSAYLSSNGDLIYHQDGDVSSLIIVKNNL